MLGQLGVMAGRGLEEYLFEANIGVEYRFLSREVTVAFGMVV